MGRTRTNASRSVRASLPLPYMPTVLTSSRAMYFTASPDVAPTRTPESTNSWMMASSSPVRMLMRQMNPQLRSSGLRVSAPCPRTSAPRAALPPKRTAATSRLGTVPMWIFDPYVTPGSEVPLR